jgi:hypothetical protein
MNLSSPTVSQMLSKESIDSIKYLQAISELTETNFEWLRTGEGPETLTVEKVIDKYEIAMSEGNNREVESEAEISLRRQNERLLSEMNDMLKARVRELESTVKQLNEQLSEMKKTN